MKRMLKVSSVLLLCAVFGIQAYAGGRKGPEVKAVDNALYKAKKQGRNQIVVMR